MAKKLIIFTLMKVIFSIIIFCLIGLTGNSQVKYNKELEGVWQGLLVQRGMAWETSYIIWMEIKIDKNGIIKGLTRDETPNTDFYALKECRGQVKKDSMNAIKLNQQFIIKEKSGMSKYWCISNYELTYHPETGYLKGPWTSSDCRGTYGKVILYKSTYSISKNDRVTQAHTWRDDFIKDIKAGRKAPLIRKKELEEFDFKPIYFDYDKDSIRPEYQKYLSKMVNVVQGHSDLRIKIIGHTDADGSLEYNDELSKKRADRIKNFFISEGLREDRIVIEFKGEKDPAATNSTDEGKQLNRRVDFEFI